MDPVKVGMVGAGRHGSRYIDHMLNDLEEIELSAILRSNTNKQLERRWKGKGIDVVRTMDELIKTEPHLIIVATPTDTHFELAADALRSGIDVLVEKPLCGNTDQCIELMDMERNSKAKVTVAQTLRYAPSISLLREKIADSGPVRWFEAVNALEPPKTPWLREERAMGGCVLNTGVHSFDLINTLLGDISSATCWTESILNPVWEDYAYGNLTLRDGTEGSFKFSRNTQLRTRYIRVDLQEGFIWADTLTDTVYDVNEGIMKKQRAAGERFTIVPLLQDMVKVVRREMEPPVPSIDGTRAVAAAEACYESSRKDREIRLKSLETMR